MQYLLAALLIIPGATIIICRTEWFVHKTRTKLITDVLFGVGVFLFLCGVKLLLVLS